MRTPVTSDDVGKRVENANGEVVGTVTAVEGDTLSVEPDEHVLEAIAAAVGWEGDLEGAVPVHVGSVGEVTDEAIRLEPMLAGEDSTSGTRQR